jgi:2-methylcitrate dehydratase
MAATLAQQFAAMIVSTDAAAMPASSLDALRTSVTDTLGCAIGAARLPDAPDAKAFLAALAEPGQVPIIGGAGTAAPGAAAFVNGSLARYLDFNDTFIGARNPAHPSDVIMALLGLAHHLDAPGRRFAEAVAAGYATVEWINDHCTMMRRGWDLVTPIAIGTAAGAAKLLGLGVEETACAVGIAVVDNVTLFQTRVGEISQWKGLASGSAARKGLFAAQVAGAGATGPLTAFEGRNGLFAQLGCDADSNEVAADLWKAAPARVNLKAYPVQYFSQAAVEAGMVLHARGIAPERIAALHVRANSELIRGTAGDRSRWRPRTRETADHSLPFCLAVPILHGNLRLAHFDQETLDDPRLHALMEKIEIVADPELDQRYPASLDLIVSARLADGSSIDQCIPAPLGYATRPLTPGQAKDKFLGLAEGLPVPAQALWTTAWTLVDQTSVRPAFGLLAGGR